MQPESSLPRSLATNEIALYFDTLEQPSFTDVRQLLFAMERFARRPENLGRNAILYVHSIEGGSLNLRSYVGAAKNRVIRLGERAQAILRAQDFDEERAHAAVLREREVAAQERMADAAERSARAQEKLVPIGIAAALATAAAALSPLIVEALQDGELAKPARKILGEIDGDKIYVSSAFGKLDLPEENIPPLDVIEAISQESSQKRKLQLAQLETNRLLRDIDNGQRLSLIGRFVTSDGLPSFETKKRNIFLVSNQHFEAPPGDVHIIARGYHHERREIILEIEEVNPIDRF